MTENRLMPGFYNYETSKFSCRDAEHARESEIADREHQRMREDVQVEHEWQREQAQAEHESALNLARVDKEKVAKEEEEKTKREMHVKEIEKELKQAEKQAEVQMAKDKNEAELKIVETQLQIEQERTKQQQIELQKENAAASKVDKVLSLVEAIKELDDSAKQLLNKCDVFNGQSETQPAQSGGNFNSRPLQSSIWSHRAHVAFSRPENVRAQNNTPQERVRPWTTTHAILSKHT